jgi:outer membrane protein OmpA-like peptidoglycan-associated protein
VAYGSHIQLQQSQLGKRKKVTNYSSLMRTYYSISIKTRYKNYELEKINRHLNKKPFTKTIIEGHTDSKGSDEYNFDLSRRRAVRVKNYLIKTYGFDGSKFITKGMGEGFPVDTNETDAGRDNNRRVEFKIYRK